MYIWLLIIILLAIIEIFTIDLVTIWFIASALLALIISFFTNNFIIQFSVFVIFGIIFLILTRPIIKKMKNKEKDKTNIDRIIGMKGIVTENITKNKPGEVKVDGKLWTAYADKAIKKDSYVKVLTIESTKLKVEKEDDE